MRDRGKKRKNNPFQFGILSWRTRRISGDFRLFFWFFGGARNEEVISCCLNKFDFLNDFCP